MELEKALEQLKRYMFTDSDKFESLYMQMRTEYNTPEAHSEIDEYLKQVVFESGRKIDSFIEEVNVKLQLSKISRMVSLSYIARNYFNKTRVWLYQKINGNMVNGKPAKFTPDEIKTLNAALHDIGKTIGSTVISL
jgi:23S rRNA maturation-related 3'-5' exoribonuclease YhaM